MRNGSIELNVAQKLHSILDFHILWFIVNFSLLLTLGVSTEEAEETTQRTETKLTELENLGLY